MTRATLIVVAALLAGCGGAGPARTTARRAATPRPAFPRCRDPRRCWGLDADQPQTAATLDGALARYGADPAFIGRYVDTGGGPSPLTGAEADLYAHRSPHPIALLLIADVYARCEAVPSLGLGAEGMGRREADLAAAAAATLGVPADRGIAIFQDLEGKNPAKPECLAGYADELARRGYRPGWYGNPIRGQFNAAFCAAAAAVPVVAHALIWSSQPVRPRLSGPGTLPGFNPARPACPQGVHALWQYRRSTAAGTSVYDIDELAPAQQDGSFFWRP